MNCGKLPYLLVQMVTELLKVFRFWGIFKLIKYKPKRNLVGDNQSIRINNFEFIEKQLIETFACVNQVGFGGVNSNGISPKNRYNKVCGTQAKTASIRCGFCKKNS